MQVIIYSKPIFQRGTLAQYLQIRPIMKPAYFFLTLCLFWSQGSWAQQQETGCISGDCINGSGIYVYPSGAKYIGQFNNGEIHGTGTCYYTDGSKYVGDWAHRYPEGKGKKIYADGTERYGLWEKGQPVDEYGNIEEEYTAKDGSNFDDTNIQSGCLTGNCTNGRGVFAYPDGSRYEGQFVNGIIHGEGTFYYYNGDKYVGQFRKGFKHGEGVLYYRDGTKLSGYWEEGEFVNNGRMDTQREGCISGDCYNGTGTYVFKDSNGKYVGSFLAGKAHGKGVIYYANGERYEGELASGHFNGKGTYYKLNGTAISGYWRNNTYMGGRNPNNSIAYQSSTSQNTRPYSKPAPDRYREIQQQANLKVWAVVIGIANYNHMPVLRYTDDDAYRMYAFLKSPEGGALDDDQISILIDEDATKQNIKSTMQEVFSKAGPNDLVILYFSGHGLKGSFLPIDFDGYNNKLYHEEIKDLLDRSPAKYKLCIADACHSGSLLAMRGNVRNVLDDYYTSLAKAEPGTALIMSSKSEETSLESNNLRQGVFSHFLIRGLKGEADEDQDHFVSVKELFHFINGNVRSYTGNRQSPLIQGDYDEEMTVAVVR